MILYSLAQFWQSTYRHDRFVQVSSIISLVANLVMWVLFFWKIRPFSYLTQFGAIPLHYNVYFGIDTFGQWYSVAVLPSIGLAVLLVNNALAYALFYKKKILSYFLLITQSLVNLILLIALFFIVLLNA